MKPIKTLKSAAAYLTEYECLPREHQAFDLIDQLVVSRGAEIPDDAHVCEVVVSPDRGVQIYIEHIENTDMSRSEYTTRSEYAYTFTIAEVKEIVRGSVPVEEPVRAAVPAANVTFIQILKNAMIDTGAKIIVDERANDIIRGVMYELGNAIGDREIVSVHVNDSAVFVMIAFGQHVRGERIQHAHVEAYEKLIQLQTQVHEIRKMFATS